MEFMDKLSRIIFNAIFKTCTFTTDEEEQMLYSLEVILSELSKIIVLIFLFSLVHKSMDALLILAFTVPLRINIGGFHMKKYSSCLMVSFVYCSVIIALGHYTTIHQQILLGLSAICFFIVYLIAPVIPLERLEAQSLPKHRLKFRALLVISIYISTFLMWNSKYAHYTQWVTIVQTVLLLCSLGGLYVQRKTIDSCK